MYDVSKLKTQEQCRIVMERAKEGGLDDFYENVFRRYCEIVGAEHDDPDDPLIREFWKTLAAYEQLLTEKNCKTTLATRTRQKIRNKGVYQSLVEWTNKKIETNGFALLVEKGLPEYTAEYLVVKYGDRFPSDVVGLGRKRLEEHGIAPPDRSPLPGGGV